MPGAPPPPPPAPTPPAQDASAPWAPQPIQYGGGSPPPAAGSDEEKALTAAEAKQSGEPSARPPAPPRLTAPPGGAQGGATNPQGIDPRDAALASLISPRAAGVAGRVGLSPADTAHRNELLDEAKNIGNRVDQAVQLHRDAVDAFQQNSSALAEDSTFGRMAFQQEMQKNATKRANLEQDARDSQTRIEGHLADLESQGIDPNHYWESRTTGQKIGSAISVFFGALGAGAWGAHGQRGENTALDMINRAVQNDIDAQRTNLQKSIDLTKTRMSLDAQGFEHQRALLESERDSIQTGYTLASQDVARRAALLGQNADVQQKRDALIDALQGERDKRVGEIHDRIYALDKAAERPKAGPGNDVAARIVKRSQELADKARENGHEITPAEARRVAASEILGVDVRPGEALPSMAKEPKGGAGTLSPRLARRAAELDAQDKDAVELDHLLEQGSSLSQSDRRRAEVVAENLRNAGHKAIPENPLELIDNTSSRRAMTAEVRRGIKNERESLLKYGGGSGDKGDEDNPAGLDEDK